MPDLKTPAHRPRSSHRQELRTLTYVTLDAANGGILRNLNSRGVALQAVSPLREKQRIRLRFELRFPRLRVDAYGSVTWANASGQSGVRFVDLPTQTRQQIDHWMFSNLLEAVGRAAQPNSIFTAPPLSAKIGPKEDQPLSGLQIAGSQKDEEFEPRLKEVEARGRTLEEEESAALRERPVDLLSEIAPESRFPGAALAWLVDGLVVFAGWLLFALTFLSFAQEVPRWPLGMLAGLGGAAFVTGTYWGMFAVLGERSLGNRLALEFLCNVQPREVVRNEITEKLFQAKKGCGVPVGRIPQK